MMLWGAHGGGLELRAEGGETRLSGRFPYGRETTLVDGGRNRRALRETIAPRAFAERINRAGEEIHLLAQHDFDRPLASRNAGTLTLHEDDQGLHLEARITADLAEATYVRDLLAGVRAGLVAGLSPGFQLAPVERAEVIEERPGAMLRTVNLARLFEISIVTRPAYPEAQIEARNWNPSAAVVPRQPAALNRWRL